MSGSFRNLTLTIVAAFAIVGIDVLVAGATTGSVLSDDAPLVAGGLLLFELLLIVTVWAAYREARGGKLATLQDLLDLTPRQFELAAASLLEALGYRKVKHVGGRGDLSADLTCKDPQGRSVVQCKRYRPDRSVGSPDVQTLMGMAVVHYKARAVFVATSRFTRDPVELASKHEIVLLDGEKLKALLRRHRLDLPQVRGRQRERPARALWAYDCDIVVPHGGR